MDDREKELQAAIAAVRYMGIQLRNRRLKLKKTVAGLAFTTGLSREDIETIESGGDTGNAADGMVLAMALGLDYADLLKEALDYGKEHYNDAAPSTKIIKGGLFKGK